MIAALYVMRGGVYYGLPDVDPWDQERDARLYAGPHPVVAPLRGGGWSAAGDGLGWTCCVEQGHYGHRARKATWLYAVGTELPSLRWGPAAARLDDGYHSAEERRRAVKTGICQRLSKRQRAATPLPFRDLLLSLARSAVARREAA